MKLKPSPVQLYLNSLLPIFQFYTPWKHQETLHFLVFSGGIKWEHWSEMVKKLMIRKQSPFCRTGCKFIKNRLQEHPSTTILDLYLIFKALSPRAGAGGQETQIPEVVTIRPRTEQIQAFRASESTTRNCYLTSFLEIKTWSYLELLSSI